MSLVDSRNGDLNGVTHPARVGYPRRARLSGQARGALKVQAHISETHNSPLRCLQAQTNLAEPDGQGFANVAATW